MSAPTQTAPSPAYVAKTATPAAPAPTPTPPPTPTPAEYNCWVSNLTHSMPFAGVMVKVREVPFKDLKPGMVVRYKNPWMSQIPGHNDKHYDAVVHRLERKNIFGQWVAKGDNNEKEDMGIVSERNYLGVVEEPKEGK